MSTRSSVVATMRGAWAKVPSSTTMGSTKKGSIKCGLSVGKAKSAKLSVRVRGERRTVSGSVEPGRVVDSRA